MSEIRCGTCGQIDFSDSWDSDTGNRMKKLGLCFSCNMWDEIAGRLKDNPHAFACFKGTLYAISSESVDVSDRGYGGRPFIIKFFDGTVVRTTNLRLVGEIPHHFINRLPNNAEVIPEKVPA